MNISQFIIPKLKKKNINFLPCPFKPSITGEREHLNGTGYLSKIYISHVSEVFILLLITGTKITDVLCS
jgi:hypothetical protein